LNLRNPKRNMKKNPNLRLIKNYTKNLMKKSKDGLVLRNPIKIYFLKKAKIV